MLFVHTFQNSLLCLLSSTTMAWFPMGQLVGRFLRGDWTVSVQQLLSRKKKEKEGRQGRSRGYFYTTTLWQAAYFPPTSLSLCLQEKKRKRPSPLCLHTLVGGTSLWGERATYLSHHYLLSPLPPLHTFPFHHFLCFLLLCLSCILL